MAVQVRLSASRSRTSTKAGGVSRKVGGAAKANTDPRSWERADPAPAPAPPAPGGRRNPPPILISQSQAEQVRARGAPRPLPHPKFSPQTGLSTPRAAQGRAGSILGSCWRLQSVPLTVRWIQVPFWKSASALGRSRKSTRHSYQPWSSARSRSMRSEAPSSIRTRPAEPETFAPSGSGTSPSPGPPPPQSTRPCRGLPAPLKPSGWQQNPSPVPFGTRSLGSDLPRGSPLRNPAQPRPRRAPLHLPAPGGAAGSG